MTDYAAEIVNQLDGMERVAKAYADDAMIARDGIDEIIITAGIALRSGDDQTYYNGIAKLAGVLHDMLDRQYTLLWYLHQTLSPLLEGGIDGRLALTVLDLWAAAGLRYDADLTADQAGNAVATP